MYTRPLTSIKNPRHQDRWDSFIFLSFPDTRSVSALSVSSTNSVLTSSWLAFDFLCKPKDALAGPTGPPLGPQTHLPAPQTSKDLQNASWDSIYTTLPPAKGSILEAVIWVRRHRRPTGNSIYIILQEQPDQNGGALIILLMGQQTQGWDFPECTISTEPNVDRWFYVPNTSNT